MQSLLEKFNSELGENMNNYEITLHGKRIKVVSEETVLTLVKAIRKTLRALDEENILKSRALLLIEEARKITKTNKGMKEECFIAKSSIPNTAGLYDDILVCYCGTSACTKQRNYPLPSNFEKSVEIRADELTPEEEKAFYAHIFKTAKIL